MAGKEKVEADTDGKADAVHQLVQPSEVLAPIVGSEPIARGEVTSRLWDYIKKNKLQSEDDGREINADEKLEPLFGKKTISMFEMTKIVSQHLK
ncbi:hypothetical protein ASG43_11695 [Aureimonas sp. Leaf454]|uniref:SWIB/MDM2 domain-containing protein n=1 Tax=Aureimonas sp. Leaf454 TaxID=1736381 RepID=UPI0006FA9213|nr:SWIB/MDM2 domain-containing protein [Aureimonas sp. Leaf454]KQT46286.1 hypothetical protein ASG43_11695 [Aureimonas sp. Leaf454]